MTDLPHPTHAKQEHEMADELTEMLEVALQTLQQPVFTELHRAATENAVRLALELRGNNSKSQYDLDLLIQLKNLLEKDMSAVKGERDRHDHCTMERHYYQGWMDADKRILTWLSQHKREIFE